MREPKINQLVQAFIKGVKEWPSDVTQHYEDLALADAYDLGRELAERTAKRRHSLELSQ